ncbi:AraC family transcriptional regulator [Xanthomonas floridensis]|uniref:Helix-turn-helix domain-containing protein n=1 Tax=Xanthomonas floridensis TaxID=1843580 RepID=A0A1A9MGR6_9XANT|nr:AraC family transcriptional regulator [Xanthomonas floridensis]MEA5123484.1 helix-turn-helix domain-containing protein [Xanthomonas floridensis]MEA5130350.1 helix-turn-helix domain-containing protein [Xanthomonas floridensis]OAG69408.1 transcriptional regulator [Xanthomonas floridensis]
MEKQVFDVLQRAYLPGDSLAKMLEKIAAELSQSEILNGAVCEFSLEAEESDLPAPDQANNQTTFEQCFPVQYARQMLGTLHVTPIHCGMTTQAMTLCEQIATYCAYLIKRDAARTWAEEHLARSWMIVGVCEDVWMIDEFVEQAAYSCLPVIVRGEFGTEKEHVATLLHATAPWRDGPFVAIDCTAPADVPAAWFERAAGGTLFLQGVEELDDALQRQVAGHLRGRCNTGFALGGEGLPRIVASTTADLSRRVLAGRFSRALLSQLDVLAFELAPLRKRRVDIGFHVERMLDRHGLDHGQVVTEVLMDALLHYPWPENLQELQRVVLRLAVMTAGRPISIADIQRHAPRLLEDRAQGAQRNAHATMPQQADPPGEPAPPETPVDWIAGLPHRPGQRLASLHDALRRALVHLGEHYAESLTLGELARQAHVSQSHLGFLFRDELGIPFKPMLQQLRIEKAKELLQKQRKLRITEVALKVGFGDLSHFEKSFRRLVGVSPRAFRNMPAVGNTL